MKTFLKEWFSSKTSVSSKRIAGTAGFASGLYFAYTNSAPPEIINTLLTVSAGLLASGIIDRFGNQNTPMP